MAKLIFEDETIWLDGDIIGGYSWKDENSDFQPTKEKLWWGYVREHEYSCDDFIFWAKSVPELKARIAKYLENKKNGVKDLPQISEQISRIIRSTQEYAGKKFGYYTRAAQEYCDKSLRRLNLIEEFKKRGYWMRGGEIIERKFYELM